MLVCPLNHVAPLSATADVLGGGRLLQVTLGGLWERLQLGLPRPLHSGREWVYAVAVILASAATAGLDWPFATDGLRHGLGKCSLDRLTGVGKKGDT